MRRWMVALCLMCAASCLKAAPAADDWRARVEAEAPLLGHRNWILVVDSAYPLQSSPGVETIDTSASQIDVIRFVLRTIDRSIHVRPDIYMDAELPFVADADAPGASAYRSDIASVLRGYTVEAALHDQLISRIGHAGELFHVLVLKTNLAIPYGSVFIQLDCKYWSAEAEGRLRAKMNTQP